MKCHYEVLGIPAEADDADIKSAYRKLALKWHPDKNLDNPQLAKEQFQLVQQAYEILSDRQERAWYDSHRDQILRGANSEFQDKSLDVFQYFTTTCFKGHNDDEKGFYTVYRKVFEQIAKEDIEFMDEKEEFCEIPSFGNSNSTYEEVTQFYNYWMSYSTKKSYSWLEPHDIRDAKGYRRLLKAIEKENKKVRQEARKERNEEIRNLVAFVRKRDKRMKEFNKQLEAQKLENRKRQEMLNKQKRLERKKLNESATEAEWAKFDNFKSELEDIEKHVAREFGDESSNSDNEEEDESNLYCVACNKVFKNPKAFENHESSKKHKENVEKLKQTMREEEESLCSDDLEEYEDIEKNGMVENIPEAADSVSDTESLASEKIDKINSLEINLSLESEQEEVISTKKKSKKKNKKPKTVLTLSNENLEKNDDVPNIINDSDNDDFNTTKKQKNRKKKQQKKPEKTQNGDDNEENAPENDATSSNNTNSKNKKNKKGKTKTEVSTADLKDVDVEHCCVMCKENFSSKNKLFDHLKKTNHGVYIPKDKAKQARKNLKDK